MSWRAMNTLSYNAIVHSLWLFVARRRPP